MLLIIPPTFVMSDTPRTRSRSPRRANKGNGGFKWKDKRSSNNADDDRRDRGLERGYRNRSPRRDRDRDRDQDRDRDRNSDRETNRDRDNRPRDRDRERDSDRSGPSSKPEKDRKDKRDKQPADSSAAPKPKPAPKPKVGGEEMIIVHVNDRLGTKAAIPCFPSDQIKQFKVMVAMRIGREPHEILLKRQGQRPFKDHLTLDDYEISNGVQLDLEVDTGD